MAESNKIPNKKLMQPINDKQRKKILAEHKNNSKVEKYGSLSSSGLTRIFGIIAITLVIVIMIRFASGGDNVPTFRSFLEFLQNLPVVEYFSLDFGDWGWFNFIADFLEFIVSSIGWVLITLYNTGTYIYKILGWIVGIY